MSADPADLQEVDYMEVLVLVDNVMDILSSVPNCVTSEIPNHIAAGAKELGGGCLCCGAWGLSLAITTVSQGVKLTMLFDSGPEAYALERNAERLGFDFGKVECVAVSHGHFDHTAGLPKALELITEANGGKQVPVHVNPEMFHKRAAQDTPESGVLPLEDVPSPKILESAGGNVVNDSGSRLILDGMVYLSGEIPRITEYEKGLRTQVRIGEDGEWIPDPLQLDERYLAVNVKDFGMIIFSSCSHAGIVNVLTDAQKKSNPIPLYGIMGGLHLSGSEFEPLIEMTVKDLEQFGLQRLVVGHCTGWRAFQSLVNAYGDSVILEAVGHTHHFGNVD